MTYELVSMQIEEMNMAAQRVASAVKNITTSMSWQIFTEEITNYIDEIKESGKLSQADFEKKYSCEINMSEKLGQAGWVVSEESDPNEIKAWYEYICNGEESSIESYFQEHLHNILKGLGQKYDYGSSKRYFTKGKYFFEQGDYITSAMYLVALIEARTNELMNYPPNIRYKEKYSLKGFKEHLKNEYGKTDDYFVKSFLFLDMYPSIIKFLQRLFVDGEYTFEKGIEPPYINRNWLLHGRSSREIERYECIQLLNALSVIEFVFSLVNGTEE